MQLKTIVKIGTVISVLLFCLAVGYYAFMRLDMMRHNREVNLFSFVPEDCVGVLESDDINTFLTEYPMLNYTEQLNGFQFPGLFHFILNELNEYTSRSAHGFNGQIEHLVVSFHEPSIVSEQVIYFKTDVADEMMISDILREYLSDHFLPKEVKYRGKTIFVYPLGNDEFLAVYTETGLGVISYQKRLIEKVIDAKLDEKSLNDNPVFSEIIEQKKTRDFITLYGRTPGMPFLEMGDNGWSEYNFHLNSDVLYLTGETYVPESLLQSVRENIRNTALIKEDSLFVSSDKDSTLEYVNQSLSDNENGNRTLFNECVANLSHEATFTLVVDMQQVVDNPQRFQNYLPAFVLDNAYLLRSFILSVQLFINEGSPSHIWVFTYKD